MAIADDGATPLSEARRAELLEQARVRHWFQRIRLAPDFVTPGKDATPEKLAALDAVGLPKDMRGKRVLDIGAWDGFFAFEAERRGAEVVALDHVDKSATGFPIAAALLGSRVAWRTANIYHLDPADLGRFDLVLCLGVTYHLRHIILGLDRVRAVMEPGAVMFLETAGIDNHMRLADGRFARMADACPGAADAALLQLYPARELGNDPTNFFAPNRAGLAALLRATEFEPQEIAVGPRGFPSRLIARAVAVNNPETAFYRDRDGAVLESRPMFRPAAKPPGQAG